MGEAERIAAARALERAAKKAERLRAECAGRMFNRAYEPDDQDYYRAQEEAFADMRDYLRAEAARLRAGGQNKDGGANS